MDKQMLQFMNYAAGFLVEIGAREGDYLSNI